MKSESFKMVMLRHIVILGCLIAFTVGQTTLPSTNKSPKKSEIKYVKSASSIDLKKQQFHSTKERPELNPVLSALINEDVKKSIDAKRHAEESEFPSTTTVKPVLTTSKTKPKDVDDEVVVDSSDKPASNGKKQTSRIEIKKGPNGVDYEYEYVYYYYDDDDKDSKKSPSQTVEKTSDEKIPVRGNGGKARYSTVDRSGSTVSPSTAERNEISSSRGKGRQSIPVVEEVSEERLPVNTRFPPRSSITPSVQVISSVDETTKKISVKRPSLELVDSQSFNRGDKGQPKGTRITENEFDRDAELKEKEKVLQAVAPAIVQARFELENVQSNESGESTTVATDAEEATTQIMDKVALDLYAHLANEHSNLDLTTNNNGEVETITAESTDLSPSIDYTVAPVNPSTSTSTTTTTTTSTTTTTTTTEAPSTTTTTEAQTLVNGRRPPFGAGRNRFKIKPSAKSTVASEAPVEAKEAPTESSGNVPKNKNRFSRPTFGGRSRTTATTTTTEEAPVEKQEAKPVSSLRGRTRNRFSLRSSTAATPSTQAEEKNLEENAIDTSAQPSSTQRSPRPRPSFNLRGRARPGASTTTTTTTTPPADSESAESDVNSEAKVQAEEKPAAPAPASGHPRPGSRLNLRRPNQLLPGGRPRINPLAKTAAPATTEVPAETVNEENEENAPPAENKEPPQTSEENDTNAEASTPAPTGLNRLRNRPRLQVQPRAPNSSKSSTVAALNINRKPNPLVARRKIGASSTTTTTTEEPTPEEEPLEENKENTADKDENSEAENDTKDEPTEPPVEVSSEKPRGLGLLGNRRRLAARKPGTIL